LRAVFELRHEVDVQTLGDHPGGWHTNRGRPARSVGKSPRNLMPGSETVWASDSDSRVKRKGGLQGGWCAVLCCTAVLTVVLL